MCGGEPAASLQSPAVIYQFYQRIILISLGRNISIKSSFPNRNLSILKWKKKLVQTFWKLTFYLYKSNFWSKLIYSSKFLIHNLCMKGVDLKYKLHHKLDALWLALHLDLRFQTFNIYNSIHLNLHTLEPPHFNKPPVVKKTSIPFKFKIER